MKRVIFILISTSFIQAVSSQALYDSKISKLSKFIFTTELTRYTGVGLIRPSKFKNSNQISGLRLISSYPFFSNFQAGVGFGIDYGSMPITLEMQLFIPKKNIIPFIGGNIDYCIPLYNGVVPAMAYNPKLGIRKPVTENFAFQFSIGYRISVQEQKMFQYTTGWQMGNFYYNWISTNIGFVF